MDFAQAQSKLLTRPTLARQGVGEYELRRALADRALVRVRPGVYVACADWTAAHPDERHLMQVAATVPTLRSAGLAVCGVSAAVLFGLPLYATVPDAVHVAGHRCDGRTHVPQRPVARHDVVIPSADRTRLHGIPCTTLERTVFDVIRTVSYEAAVVCMDAVLHRIAWDADTHLYDEAAAGAWKMRMDDRLRQGRGMRGIRQARRVVAFADGRADGPLESVSRIRLAELGFTRVRLQVAVRGPNGFDYWVDFGLDDVNGWGEADGKTKYHDLGLTGGATAQAVFDAEKAREDWIRGTTHRPVARWGSSHVRSAAALGAWLAAFGLRPLHP